MVNIATRASWGARHRDGDINLTGQAGEVIIHHTVTATLPTNATVAQEQAQMRHIEQIGQDRFRQGISYNLIIFPSGRAYQGVSWNRRGTHTGGRNSTSRGIAFAGNFDTQQPTAQMIATAAAVVAHGRGRWWTTNAAIRAHRDVTATLCPGRRITTEIMGQIRTGNTPTPPPAPSVPNPITGVANVNVNLPILDLRNADRTAVTIPGTSTMQALLMAHRLGPDGLVGPNGRPNGSAGPNTRRLLLEFQRAARIADDAICGPITWRALLTPGITL